MSVDQHAQWGLVVDPRVITKLRTVKAYGQYPWVAKIIKGLASLRLPLYDLNAEIIPSRGVVASVLDSSSVPDITSGMNSSGDSSSLVCDEGST